MAGVIRSKAFTNLKKAASVGILFELDDEQTYHAVHDYVTRLQNDKVRVKVIGLVTEDRLKKLFLPVLTFDLISKKELNWFRVPVSKRTRDFVETEFDICINLTGPRNFPMKYISANCLARLKVGVFSEKDKAIYDVMIHSAEPHDQRRFLKDVHDYLSIINTKENA